MPPVRIVIDRRDSGKTVAAVVRERLNLTWAQAKRLVEKHLVRYAGQVVGDPAHRVKPGKLITINAGAVEQPAVGPAADKPKREPKPKPAPAAKPVVPVRTKPRRAFDIDILYSDDSVVVVNKPAGLTTMRDADEAAEFGKGQKFLPDTLADRVPELLGIPDRKVIAVHRIDRDTSGILVFARTALAAAKLEGQFRKHTADRRYLALVRGTPPSGRVQSEFVRDRGDGRRGSADPAPEDAKKAVTFVKVLETFPGYALVECRLETGRTHQVRIHLGEAGAPLCGETIYDRPVGGSPAPDESGAARPMLHAARLGFLHPETGDRMTWDSPPPADFAATLAALRRGPGPAS